MSSPTPRALVAGHADFATGIVSAVVGITGRDDIFDPVSNRGLSAAAVEEYLRERIEATGARVVFTDLPAGSCTMAARRLQRQIPDLIVVVGANLAALLDFAFSRAATAGEAARHAADKGRTTLAVHGGGGPLGT